MSTTAANAFRSFYPKRVLVERRDVLPLWIKYRQSTLHRLYSLLDFSSFDGNASSDPLQYELSKKLGLLRVEAPVPSVASGYDPERGVRINRHDSVIDLQVEGQRGHEQISRDLGSAALYMQNLPDSAVRPFVTGVTYSEIAAFAVRTLGFRRMELEVMDAQIRNNLVSLHQVFCDFNDVERPFVPAMVYMPTEQFIAMHAPRA